MVAGGGGGGGGIMPGSAEIQKISNWRNRTLEYLSCHIKIGLSHIIGNYVSDKNSDKFLSSTLTR